MTVTKARETSSDAVENGTVESIVLTNSCISLAPLKSFTLKNGQKLADVGCFTLKYDLLTLKMTSNVANPPDPLDKRAAVLSIKPK